MKIGIEAQRLFRKKKHGMDIVALELIRNLQQIDTDNEYIVFVRPDEDRSVIRETSNFRIVELQGGAYPFWEQVALPLAAEKYGCDILHCTGNTAPLCCSIPMVVTIHDIIYLESSVWKILTGGGTGYQRYGNLYRRLVVPRVMQKARKILTVSEFERNRISSFILNRDAEKIVTVHNGVSDAFRPVTDRALLKAVKEKYKLPDQYVFFLGNTDPKKNTAGTLKAFASLLRRTGSDLRLVMIDYDEAALRQTLLDIGEPELRSRIVLTGYIPQHDLPAVYSQALMFLYSSLRESFGIPIIEAMKCGVPVITSNTSSMPEVAGNAALLTDPFKPSAISDAMELLYRDEEIRKKLSVLGIAQAAGFSWRSAAETVLSVYRQLIPPVHSMKANYTF